MGQGVGRGRIAAAGSGPEGMQSGAPGCLYVYPRLPRVAPGLFGPGTLQQGPEGGGLASDQLLDPEPQDAVEDLRRGWDMVVEFGISRPALFAVMVGATGRGADMAHRAGLEILYGRVRRLAAGGWLRVDEELAAQIIQATGRGAVITWHSTPAERRNPALLTVLREAMVAAVTRAEPTVPAAESGPAAAARALRAALPDGADVLSNAEQRLLREWLTRLAADGGAPHA
ncbi:hypothetical protein [Streptomyces canus]|uniref:hypothetical protein n=1 Tax=Streptomyces canus TaxID=58343 RepID=UPI000B253C43|nr:hypothetical protein [Streptomyces canus]